ncbi:N-acetylmuramate alpha-1-phosphate uridylyltransferase MurU [Aliidiomarina sp.]|uniref:N-acetylmuramate alpha-1-phosphate uridylyltransferase MurU n=1 Tax=Aliidiomarina sp. TaxID=1872439 RepID=UPI003A4E14FD
MNSAMPVDTRPVDTGIRKQAMILAAGRGERMRPLTDHTPKPLLTLAGKPLIVWHIEKLAAAGVTDIVVNTAWLGEQLQQQLGNGEKWGVRIQWSPEPAGGLETAGGIMHALPYFQDQPFIVVNGDIWSDFAYSRLLTKVTEMAAMPHILAHLVLVNNPIHHPQGDFTLRDTGVVDAPGLTFSGMSVLHPQLFYGSEGGFLKLRPFLSAAMQRHAVTGEHHQGSWADIGTPERLSELNAQLSSAD